MKLHIYMCVYIYIYIYTHTHTHNGILFSHKKKEILPFVTIYISLKSIMLSAVRQRKTKTVWTHLYVESKNIKLRNRVEWCLPGAEGWRNGEMMVKGSKLLVIRWINPRDLSKVQHDNYSILELWYENIVLMFSP